MDNKTEVITYKLSSTAEQEIHTHIWIIAFLILLLVFLSVTSVLVVQVILLRKGRKRRLLSKSEHTKRTLPNPPTEGVTIEQKNSVINPYLRPTSLLSSLRRSRPFQGRRNVKDDQRASHDGNRNHYEDIESLPHVVTRGAPEHCPVSSFKETPMTDIQEKESDSEDEIEGYEKPCPHCQAPSPESVNRVLPQMEEIERLINEKTLEAKPGALKKTKANKLPQSSIQTQKIAPPIKEKPKLKIQDRTV